MTDEKEIEEELTEFEKQRKAIEDAREETKEINKLEGAKEILTSKIDMVSLEKRMADLEKNYAESMEAHRALKEKILRSKAQGKAVIPGEDEGENSKLKKLYPELAHYFD